jgi:hypothetical protein
LNDLLPKAKNMYQAKKIVCPLGLEVEKIHACRNNCMLFHNKDAMLEECRVCRISRYKRNDQNIDEDDMGENKKVKRVPTKMAWYFPIITHLHWLFVNKANAELLQCHARQRKKDAMLCHPADGIQWRNFDQKHKDFAVEVRNIIFRLSIDGMNPFGETLFFQNFPNGFELETVKRWSSDAWKFLYKNCTCMELNEEELSPLEFFKIWNVIWIKNQRTYLSQIWLNLNSKDMEASEFDRIWHVGP